MVQEYRCTRNASYSHDCIGKNDPTVRQGYYIQALSREEALEKMAIRFPEELKQGFTIEEWKSFNVTVVEKKSDEKKD